MATRKDTIFSFWDGLLVWVSILTLLGLGIVAIVGFVEIVSLP